MRTRLKVAQSLGQSIDRPNPPLILPIRDGPPGHPAAAANAG
jgi:hypothetical protein